MRDDQRLDKKQANFDCLPRKHVASKSLRNTPAKTPSKMVCFNYSLDIGAKRIAATKDAVSCWKWDFPQL
jgi:hypothetical protein